MKIVSLSLDCLDRMLPDASRSVRVGIPCGPVRLVASSLASADYSPKIGKYSPTCLDMVFAEVSIRSFRKSYFRGVSGCLHPDHARVFNIKIEE